MNRFAAVAVALILPAVLGARPLEDRGEGFEVRRAEIEPAAGLTEVSLPGLPKIYVHAAAELTAADVESARLDSLEAGKRTASIEVTLTDEGARKAAQLSAEHSGKPVAFVVDGRVVSAPKLLSKITKTFHLAGLTKDDAEKILDALNNHPPR